MAIQHRDLKDPQLHEPKGVETANDGEVYVADGVGGGSWIDVSLVNPHNKIAYASKSQNSENPAIELAIIAAGDATLRDFADYTSFTDDMPEGLSSGITFDVDGNFVIGDKGIYQFNFWMAESNTISDGELAVAIYVNQDDSQNLVGPVVGAIMRDKTKQSTDINSLGFTGIIPLEAGDVLGVAMASGKVGTVSLSDVHISIILLEDKI